MRQSRFLNQSNQTISSQKREQTIKHLDLKQIEYRNGIYQGLVNKNNEKTGLGIHIWDSGEVYFGEWKFDKTNGQGIYFLAQGGFVHGFFYKNKLNGPAFIKFLNGDTYEGIWNQGQMEGECFKYYRNQNFWVKSEYKNGQLIKVISQGQGRPESQINQIQFKDGGQYLGKVKNGLPNGLGIFRYTDGKYDVGFYKKGKLDGLGRVNLQNGDIYDGFIKQGNFEGIGLYYQDKSQQWIYGKFKNNKCTNVFKKGKGNYPQEIIGLQNLLLQKFIYNN
ncbi:hypothetical protein IMG5_107220 [Ichthyophthirius multifiliis]|uniref:MORN repeat-containing protein 3 n=1 Tax=Ichthyophthirius multifiliis TaxID=5932 RepID=G0QTC7_ICHMU|nr:hypothetical protein IMG5_107220 [Ichthyophthirius multifiliis]EGR31504.1 hypothetical protein IMG5_107220 [Ichthyophthirius multifiliis]|eukprot:XP_004034990.1 hypothetical protein IMG5_107220 [Ichthyophthirius multifiliis]